MDSQVRACDLPKGRRAWVCGTASERPRVVQRELGGQGFLFALGSEASSFLQCQCNKPYEPEPECSFGLLRFRQTLRALRSEDTEQ